MFFSIFFIIASLAFIPASIIGVLFHILLGFHRSVFIFIPYLAMPILGVCFGIFLFNYVKDTEKEIEFNEQSLIVFYPKHQEEFRYENIHDIQLIRRSKFSRGGRHHKIIRRIAFLNEYGDVIYHYPYSFSLKDFNEIYDFLAKTNPRFEEILSSQKDKLR